MTYCLGGTEIQMIPKNIYCEDDISIAIGSLDESLDFTAPQSDSENIDSSQQQRWNCDVGLNDVKTKQTKMNFLEDLAAEEASFFVIAPKKDRITSWNPEFFPTFEVEKPEQDMSIDYYSDQNDPKRKLSFQRKSKISRISRHSRMEMWQHQITKPFRALTCLRANPRSDDPTCFGKKVIDSIISQSVMSSLDCSKARKLVRGSREDQDSVKFHLQKSSEDKEMSIFLEDHDFVNIKPDVSFLESYRDSNFPNSQKFHFVNCSQWLDQSTPTDESSVSSADESAAVLDIDVD
jgi:hypothetical protein